MDDKSEARRWEAYSKYVEEIRKRELSNSDNFDKAILTLSSAALGLCVTFIRQLASPTNSSVMIASCLFFVLAIIGTLLSFLLSQKALQRCQELAERYYIQQETEALTAENTWADYSPILAFVSGALFVLGIVSFLVFVSLNVG